MSRLPTIPRARAVAAALVVVCLAALAPACGTSAPVRHRSSATGPARHATVVPNPAASAPQRRPNLLVIETDDMRWDDLRFMPSVRALIQGRGLTMENSFAPYPLCCPSRASFMTGKYAHNHHVYSHLSPYGFGAFHDRHTIATVLQHAGYRTALVGKYLNNYGVQRVQGTRRSSLHYVPPGWTQWYAGSDHNWPAGDPRYGGGTYSYFNLVQNINGRIVSFPGRYSTDVLAEQARHVVTEFSRGRAPWFVWWTPVAPHFGSPLEPDDPSPSLRSDGGFTTWETPARPSWVKGRFDHMVIHGAGTPLTHSAEADVSDKPRYLRKQPELDAAERSAETEVTRQRGESLYALDVQVRRTLARLAQLRELDRTVIVFTSDNGYYLGEHRKRSGKINLHEPSLRVPLIVAGPGVPHGRRYDPVSTVDLAPTLAAYAGARMRGADGTDLGPLIRSGDRGWRRAVVTEGMMSFGRYATRHKLGPSPLNTRGLRLGRWKLTRYSTGETELYDLWTDPLELRNLAHVKADRAVLQQMRQLYSSYASCRGAGCRAPLPQAFQLTPAENRRITDHEVLTTNRYFGN